MTKQDIIAHLQDRKGFSKATATAAVEGVMEALSSSLIAGEDVFLRGFATFKVKQAAEKKARDISKGTVITVPARKTVSLKLSKELKNAMNS